MKGRGRLALALAAGVALVLAVAAAYGGIVWKSLDAAQREAAAPLLSAYAGDLLLLIAMLALALGLALAPLYRAYVFEPLRLAQATRLIATANPAHRLAAPQAAELRELAAAINLLAARYESEVQDARDRAEAARRSVEQEKNQLAALMDELAHPVIVCNVEGVVLLYNAAARELFRPRDTPVGHALLGLGRSVFALVDRTLVAHSLARLNDRLRRSAARPAVHFVCTTPAGEPVRTQMAAVRGGDRLDGYILTFSDDRGGLALAERRETSLHALAEGGRAALANVRAAAEALDASTSAETNQRASFLRVIREESDSLVQRLEDAARLHGEEARAQWPLEALRCSDLAAIALPHVEHALGLDVLNEGAADDAWVRVDSYALLHLLSTLARRLRDAHGARMLYLRAAAAGGQVHLDLGAKVARTAAAGDASWESLPAADHGELAGRTVRQILERHDAQAWQQTEADNGGLYFRLLLPRAQPQAEAPAIGRLHESRPEFYDFDLFHQPGQTSDLESCKLSELAYTVFDTETTGLEPSRGDEIVAIGAVRIVNGRILPHEAFEQLVDPCRALSPGSARITGIDSGMLRGQPTIAAVLPLFHRYCKDTVLVAHNAAFDMRFLQLKEAAAGVAFSQPVLDTLLLSAVLHPALDSHRLEAIAERHGVDIMGRHTALGDAMVTAEIFVRMIPQLAERGIVTLRDAQQAAQRTYYARLRY